jgi:hypothetical protein
MVIFPLDYFPHWKNASMLHHERNKWENYKLSLAVFNFFPILALTD